ncbi:MAG TPA: cystathionine gamma-synthase family protein [Fibrobacteria bacterium]|nr:cystathionine gamma-synthase family protein [Fibrobacteria bacterium]
MKNPGFTTNIIHSDRLGKPEHGSLHKPVHTSIAYGYDKAEDLAAVFQGTAQGYAYARQANPTVSALERKVTGMEQGVATVCFSTGMAALGAVLTTLLRKGDHVVSSAFLFGNTNSLLNTLAGIGIDVTFVDATDVARVEAAVTPATRLVLVETIANPATQVADMARIGALCQAKGLVYVVDNTLTSPYLFLPKGVKASLSVNSLSKYFGGHGNALGGSVTDTGLFDWSAFPNILDIYKTGKPSMYAMLQLRKKGLRDFGGTLAPEAAHVLSVGSETLALRMDRACGNAARIALFLSTHRRVKAVHYPGLNSHPQNSLAKELFKRPGALLSFVLADSVDPFAFLNRLKLAICSSNLGDNRTLIIPVAQTIFYEMGPARRAGMGIEDGMIRLSVGIEDAEDLLEDFAQALG